MTRRIAICLAVTLLCLPVCAQAPADWIAVSNKYTNQLLATVARRHSGVDGQESFNRWVEDMELNDPAKFLPRLRNVVDVLVQDEWWFDRDALQAALPAD